MKLLIITSRVLLALCLYAVFAAFAVYENANASFPADFFLQWYGAMLESETLIMLVFILIAVYAITRARRSPTRGIPDNYFPEKRETTDTGVNGLPLNNNIDPLGNWMGIDDSKSP